MLTNMQRVGIVRHQSYVYGDLTRDLPTLFWFQTSQRLLSICVIPTSVASAKPYQFEPNYAIPSVVLHQVVMCQESNTCEYVCLVTEFCLLNYFYTLICSVYLFQLVSLWLCICLSCQSVLYTLTQTPFLMLRGQCEHCVGWRLCWTMFWMQIFAKC